MREILKIAKIISRLREKRDINIDNSMDEMNFLLNKKNLWKKEENYNI